MYSVSHGTWAFIYFHHFEHVFFKLTFERVIVASFVFKFFGVSSADDDVFEHFLKAGSILMAAFFLLFIIELGSFF